MRLRRLRTLLCLPLLLAAAGAFAAPLARADVFGSLAPGDGTSSGQYLVKFAAGTSEEAQAAALAEVGATDLSYVAPLRLHSVALSAADAQALVDQLRASPIVARVEVEETREASAAPSDPQYASQWALPRIGWDQVYGAVVPSGSATVAVLDTGVDATHADLVGNVVPGVSMLEPGQNGTTDPNGHGTEMAGIVAASTDNGEGVAGVGYAGVKVMPATVLDSAGVGQDGDIINGVVWAADHGADVILMPFSSPDFSLSLQEAIDYAWSKGAVLVGATGNDASSSAHFPAGARGVVGVANTDQDDALNASSNFGAAAFLAAPGTGITTTTAGGGYGTITGTSASAAAVAGAAALIKANSPDASNGVIVGRLARNADATPNLDTGNGRLNLSRAITDVTSDPVKPDGAAPVGAGGPFVGPYVAAANNDAHVAPGWAATSTTVTFSSLYRKTTGGTVQHVRITLPVGYTNISVASTAFSSGTWSTPVVDQVNRTIDVQLTAGTGLATNNVDWARIDVTATTPPANQSGNAAEWLIQTFTNTAGTAGEQNDNPPVLIGLTTNPSATITFVDGTGNPITDPVLQNGVAATVRVRITQSGNGVKYTDIAVPTCFSTPTGVTATLSAGGNVYDTPVLVTDGFIRLSGGSIATNGTLTVTFNTTPNCTSGVYLVSSDPSTNANNPPSGTNQSVSTTGGSLTVAAGRADLSITKTDSPDPVATGGTLTYTLGVSNAGPDDASAVKVVDTLPAGTTFLTATGTNWNCTHSGGVVTCNRTGGNLAPGPAPNITITVTAPNTERNITNSATVSSPNDNTPGNNTATATTTVEHQGTIQLFKAWVGGTGNATLNIGTSAGGSQVTSKSLVGTGGSTDKKTVKAQTYFVSETFDSPTNAADYEATLDCFNDADDSGSKDPGEVSVTPGANNSVAVGRNEHIICTFTNKRKPRVKVTKSLTPAADGGKFDLQVNGVTKQANAGDGGTTGYVNVAVGSNPTVGELAGTGTSLADYESSIACSGDSSASSSNSGPLSVGALSAGQTVDCTITNKRKPRVKVTKSLTPAADGGKFDLQVNGVTKQANAGDGGTTGYVNVAVGSNPTVGELAGTGTSLADYESSIACSGDSTASSTDAGPLNVGALSAGQTVDCTITNKRKPRVKLTKDLYPSTDGGKFDLKVNGVTKKADAVDGDSTGYVSVAIGSNPTVGELAGSGTDLGDYESSIDCTGASSASASGSGPLSVGALAAGDVVDCTVTNKRKPRVKVTKSLTPSDDTGKFDLQVNGLTKKADAGDGDTTGYVNVAVGSNPTVGELAGTGTSLADYESSIACSGDSSASSTDAGPLNVGALSAGQTVDCTITNKRKPRVKVTKDLYPSTDGGKFNLQVNGTTKKADAVDGDSTGYVSVAIGSNPTVGELAGSGTDLGDYESSIDCTGDSAASSTDAGPLELGELAAGDVVDCTVTNKRKPRVKVTKDLYPSTDGGKFDLKVNGVTKKADAVDGDSTGYVNVAVGSNPSVAEAAGTGTDLGDYESSIACTGDSSASSSNAGPLSVGTLSAGQTVDCTVTNKRKPRVSVTKSLTPNDDSGKFDLQVNGTTHKVDAGDGGTTGYVNVAVDSKPTVGELGGTGTDLADYESSIACTGDSDASSTNSGPLTLDELAAGDTVDCTVTNKRKPRVKVTKDLYPSTDGGKFDLQVNGTTKQADAADGGTTGYVNVAVDSNPSVGELAGTGTDLADYESSIACTGDSTASSTGSGPLSVGSLAAGQTVDCTVTNKRKPRVKVTKDLYPSADGGRFDLQVNGVTKQANAGDGGTTGYVNVAVDSNPTVGELAGTGTDLADYESSIACTGDSTASSTDSGPLSVGSLSAGQTVDCTVTNKRKPRVKVTKDLYPSTDGGKFDLQVNGTTHKVDAGDGGTTGYVNVAVDSKPTVGELGGTGTDLADYESSIACTGDSDESSTNSGPLTLDELGAGDTVDCTITNNRKPRVKVTKDLYPSADGGKFDLKVNGLTKQTDAGDGGTTGYVNVPVGSNPSVAEAAGTGTDLAEYESSIACSGDSTASSSGAGPLQVGDLAAGDVVDCTVTNKRKPRVKVTKDLYPSADGGKFDLQVNGTTHEVDAGDGGTTGYVNVAVDSKPTVGELAGTGTDLADYESSIACTGDSDETSPTSGPLTLDELGAGATVDCTVTNKRKPRVKVTKDLYPSTDGGKFDLQVNGTTKQVDAGDGGTTGYVNVAVDSKPTVGELAGTGTDLADYESSIDCTGDSDASSTTSGPLTLDELGAGATVDCTVTNKRKPQVKVTKDLYPSADGGKFDLKVNGVTKQTDAGDGGTTGYVNVPVGSNPSVAEAAGTGTDLADYESSIDCSGDSSASATGSGPLSVGTLSAGQKVDCTVTNKRKPRVKVTKDLYPSTDGGRFDLKVNGTTQKTDAGDGGTTGYVNVAVGSNPSVAEAAGTATSLSDYESSIACTGGSNATSNNAGPLQLGALAAGDTVDCTVTNGRKAQLAVVKKLDPTTDNGTFNLQIDGVTKKENATHNDTTGFLNVANGVRGVGEVNGTNSPNTLADYESSITCDNGDTNGVAGGTTLNTSTLGYGDKVTCAITNKRKPRVRVTKDLYPSTDGGKFNLRVNGTTKKADAVDNDTTGYVNVAVGSNPTVSETAGTGSDLANYEASIACTGDSTASSNDSGPLSVGPLAAGKTADCTVTNKRKPEIKVVKKLDPATDGGKFDLKIDTTNFDNGGAGYGDGGTTGFQHVAVGNHSVSEAGHGTTSLGDYDSKVVCDSNKGTIDPGTTHNFSVAYGDKVTCEITNKRKAIVTGVKFEDQNSDGSKAGDPGLSGWDIRAYKDENNNSTADAAELKATTTTGSGGAYTLNLSPGTYVICEVGKQNWVQTSPGGNSRCQGVSSAPAGHLVNFTSGPIQSDKDFGNAHFDSGSTLTDSAFRLVDDLSPWTIGDFEILLNPKNEIVATNPGQFYYHQRATNTSGGTSSMSFVINWPCQFQTQTSGGQPIHAYVQYASDSANTWRDWLSQSTGISWTNQPVASCVPTTSAGPLGEGKITVGNVPAGAKVWVNVHLDYSLKTTTAPSATFGNPPINYRPFQSTATTTGGASYSGGSLLGRGKKVTVVYGRMIHKTGGAPINNVWIRLTQGTNTATTVTDIDGNFVFFDSQGCADDGLVRCTGVSNAAWNFATGNNLASKLEIMGDGSNPTPTAAYPASKTNAIVYSGNQTFATLTGTPLYTFNVSKNSAYDRDWKFGP